VTSAGIWVLAGTNGAGKSTMLGEAIRDAGAEYFNPDSVALQIQQTTGASSDEANVAAWRDMVRLLERTIKNRSFFAFETTLGGETITNLLAQAIAVGLPVHVWYAALATPELHIERVRARVAQGGHDIAEDRIRARYVASPAHLCRLVPGLAELVVFDNSADSDPQSDDNEWPGPLLVIRMVDGEIIEQASNVPSWAQPIVDAARAIDRS
jgi:predicted ABC-type ATPase